MAHKICAVSFLGVVVGLSGAVISQFGFNNWQAMKIGVAVAGGFMFVLLMTLAVWIIRDAFVEDQP